MVLCGSNIIGRSGARCIVAFIVRSRPIRAWRSGHGRLCANYETWKRDVVIWCKLNDFPAEEQALANFMSLEERPRDV